VQTDEIDIELPDICADAILDIRENDERYLVLKGGRGSAKSHSIARGLLILAGDIPLRVLCGREIQRSIRDSVHRLLGDTIAELQMDDHYQVMDTEIRGKNGSLFSFAGLAAHTVDTIKSYEGYDICWLEEAQSLSQKTLDVLIPTIRKPRSRFIVSMNPRLKTDPASKRWLIKPDQMTRVITMNWRDNPWFKDTELEAERIAHKERDPDTYDHIWEGAHLPAVEGAIFFGEIQSAEAQGRIRDVPYDPMLKVHTFWDLGRADSTSIIMCQVVGSEIRIFDFIEDSNKALSHYVAELQERRYNWGDDYIPHDGFHRRIETGKSTADLLQGFGRSVQRTPDVGVLTGIQTAREVFPRVYVDKSKCERLIIHLQNYRWDVPTNDKDATRPRHDEHSHAADAWRYMCVSAHLLSNDGWGQKIEYPSLVAA
jgi:phage terminase large subunit